MTLFTPCGRFSSDAIPSLFFWRRRGAGTATTSELGQTSTAGLEARIKELETFSYSVVHDLRTPLRSMAGFIDILREDHSTKLDDEGQRILGFLGAATQRMDRLIDEFMAFSRIGCLPLVRSVIDMRDLALTAFDELAQTARGAISVLEVESLPTAYGDQSMVRQVFANLVGNAIKFTRGCPGPRIVVTGQTVGDWNTYCVADNGVGFDQQQAPRLFNAFQRLHRDEDFEGTGVGLALVRTIVQRHGGTVRAEGKINAGSRFYFTLPHHQNTRT